MPFAFSVFCILRASNLAAYTGLGNVCISHCKQRLQLANYEAFYQRFFFSFTHSSGAARDFPAVIRSSCGIRRFHGALILLDLLSHTNLKSRLLSAPPKKISISFIQAQQQQQHKEILDIIQKCERWKPRLVCWDITVDKSRRMSECIFVLLIFRCMCAHTQSKWRKKDFLTFIKRSLMVFFYYSSFAFI